MKNRNLIQLILIGAALCLGAACSDKSEAEEAAEEAVEEAGEGIEEAGDAIRDAME